MATTRFPSGGRAIIERMIAAFPQLFVNDDAIQRVLTQKIGEQFAFTFGPSWGNKKRADLSDDFRSKDSIAVREADGSTSVWDMFSSGLVILVHDGDLPAPGTHANLPPSEATFMPCVPINHLGIGVPQLAPSPLPSPVPPSPIACLAPALDPQIAALRNQINELTATVALLDASVRVLADRPAPKYTGQARLGYTMTFTLTPQG